MRRKVRFIIPLFLVLMLVACASWDTTAKKAYVSAGNVGKAYYNTAKTSCDQKLLEPARCEQLKKINNDARAIWLQAGNALMLAIQVDDAVKKQEFKASYNALMGVFEQDIGEFLKLYLQMGGKL